MGSYLSDAALFLVDTILGIYILLVLLRFLLQLARADFYNPISQFIVRVTNPPLVRLRRFIPGLLGIDLAALALLIAMEVLRISLSALLLGHIPEFAGLSFSVRRSRQARRIYRHFQYLYPSIIKLARSRASAPNRTAGSFTDPMLRPIQRILPATGGIDLSPLILFILMMLLLVGGPALVILT